MCDTSRPKSDWSIQAMLIALELAKKVANISDTIKWILQQRGTHEPRGALHSLHRCSHCAALAVYKIHWFLQVRAKDEKEITEWNWLTLDTDYITEG